MPYQIHEIIPQAYLSRREHPSIVMVLRYFNAFLCGLDNAFPQLVHQIVQEVMSHCVPTPVILDVHKLPYNGLDVGFLLFVQFGAVVYLLVDLLGDLSWEQADHGAQESDKAVDLFVDAGLVFIPRTVDILVAAVQVLQVVEDGLVIVLEVLFDWAHYFYVSLFQQLFGDRYS